MQFFVVPSGVYILLAVSADSEKALEFVPVRRIAGRVLALPSANTTFPDAVSQ